MFSAIAARNRVYNRNTLTPFKLDADKNNNRDHYNIHIRTLIQQ